MQKLGFPYKWRDWIAALLLTSSSRVLLNRVPNAPIKHGRGLRQGDPLSPLLFVLAIDPLQKQIELATELQMLTRLRGRTATIHTSMYADDMVIFVNPVKEDVTTLANILNNFGEVSGLQTNFQKSTVVPIRCEAIDLEDVLSNLPAKRGHFPIKYLGLPLSPRRLKRVDFQPLIDKAVNKLTF